MKDQPKNNNDKRRPEWDKLLLACQRNDVAMMETWLSSSSSLSSSDLPETILMSNHANDVGQSALHIAAWWGHVESVELLLKFHANVHATNLLSGATPLHMVLQSTFRRRKYPKKFLQCLNLLLEHGADPKACDVHGKTPMDYLLLEDDNDNDNDNCEMEAQFRQRLQPKQQQPHIFQTLLSLSTSSSSLSLESRLDALKKTILDDPTTQAHALHHGRQTPLLIIWLTHQIWNHHENDDNDDDDDEEEDEDSVRLFWTRALVWVISLSHHYPKQPAFKVDDESSSVMDILCHVLYQRYKQLVKKTSTKSSWKDDAICQGWIHAVSQLQLQQQQQLVNDNSTNHDSQESPHDNDDDEDDDHPPILPPIPSMTPTIVTATKRQDVWLEMARRNDLELAQTVWWNTLGISPRGVTNRQGMTPLQFAARSGHLEMVQLLAPLSALDHQDALGQTALDAARANHHDHVVSYLSSLS